MKTMEDEIESVIEDTEATDVNEFLDDENSDNVSSEITELSCIDDIDDVSLCMLLQKVNRILAENENIVVTSANNSMCSIGATDLKHNNIMLNYYEMKKFADGLTGFLTITKGVNYHELAHILYTLINEKAIKDFWYAKDIEKNYNSIISFDNLFEGMNLLEDCRIENLFSAVYDRAKYYFSFAAINILLNFKTHSPERYNLANYLVLYGRKFLTADLTSYKKELKNIDNKIIVVAEKIVDDYIIEVDQKKQLELAYNLTELLIKNNQSMNSTSGSGSLQTSGKKGGKKKGTQNAVDKLKEALESGSWEKDSSGNDEKENEDGDLENTNSEKKGKKKGTDNESDSGDEKSNDNSNSTGTKSDGEKGSNSTSEQKSLQKIKNKINRSLVNVEKEVTADLNTLTVTMRKDSFSALDGQKFTASDLERNESRKVERVLKLLRGDLSTSIRKFQSSGTLDIQSAIKAEKESNMGVFRKFRMNKVDKSKLGVSILLDSSSSISGPEFDKEISAAWCLADAFKALNNKVEVIEFSDNSKVIKSFNSEGDWKRHYCRGTTVTPALEIATNDLNKLRTKEGIRNLVVIVVSDGQFADTSNAIKQFNKLRSLGIKTVWILVKDYEGQERSIHPDLLQSIDVFIGLAGLSKLSKEIEKLVKKLQADINHKIQTGSFY